MNQHDDFRDRLIASQQFSSEFQEEYDRRLQTMFQRELTLTEKIWIGVSVLMGLLAIAFVWISFSHDSETSPPLKFAIGFLCLIVLVITGIRAYILATGRIDTRFQPKVIAYIAYAGIILFIAALLMISTQARGIERIYVILVSFFPLILIVAKVLTVQISQSELNVREKLLEMELQLAEMNEKISEKQRDMG